MSFKLDLTPKDRAAGRFIGKVRKALVLAAIEEKEASGISQASVAGKLDVDRSWINRLLRGKANLTLRTVGELAWALGWEPVFYMQRRSDRDRANYSATDTFSASSHNRTVVYDGARNETATSGEAVRVRVRSTDKAA